MTTNRQRFVWVTIEAREIIELKEAIMDRDSHDVVDFFWRVVLPRAKEAAGKRGISIEDEIEEDHGHLPG